MLTKRTSQLIGACAATLAVSVAVPSPARGDDPRPVAEGLAVSSKSLYVLDVAAHSVHVTVDTTLSNQSPPRGNSYSYIDTFRIPVLAEAANPAATDGGGAPLGVSLEPTQSPYVSAASIDLSPDLLYGDTQVLHLSYDLPALTPRSTGLTRNNDAFVTFPVFPVADPGQADVEVDVPKRFAVETVGGDLSLETGADVDRYTARSIADPLGFEVFVAASDEQALASTTVNAAGTDFTVHAWPDDAAWGDFVASEIAKAVPDLATRVGLAIPVDGVDLFETVTPYLYGYAGWYTRKNHRIDVGDELDPVVVVHEISHTWFNDSLIDSRWVEEGLAQEYAAQVVQATGDHALDVPVLDQTAPGALRLAQWANPDLTSLLSLEQEAFGYDASYAAIHAIAAELGPDHMREVLAAASDHTIAYRGEGDVEKADGHADWHHFLDLVDEVGGAKQADQVVRDLVATPEEAVLLDQRDQARAAYQAFVAGSGGWSAPLAVRSAMGRWSFGVLDALLSRSVSAKQATDEVVTELQPLGVEPTALRADYETASSLDALDHDIEVAKASAGELVKADAAVHGSHGPLASVGLVGGGAARELATARRAMSAGRYDDATAAARRAQQTVSGATTRGISELGAAALVAAVLVAGIRTRRRVRDRERSMRPPRTDWSPAGA